MEKFDALVRVLDSLRSEVPASWTSYHPADGDTEGLDRARGRAFIHLFLKARFGLIDVQDRAKLVTDGPQDGGIDAYYIDHASRKIYFIQSKFRTSAGSFSRREILLDDLLKMDVDRVTRGLRHDEHGVAYNGKIAALIDEIAQIREIVRYQFIVVLLANVRPVSISKLQRVIGEFEVEIVDHNRCYDELLFPVLSGTYYKSEELAIDIDLSEKMARQSLINYPVRTAHGDCDITLLFVPTLEIAKILHRYKNAILRYNPRTYLGFATNDVNREIAATIMSGDGNEFSVFNNGITMLSDDTDFSDRIGRPHRGRLHVRNPQIINGGQTAFTLSRLYEQHLDGDGDFSAFAGKEVMLKIITFVGENADAEQRKQLIEAISRATNLQTKVSEADRRANDVVQMRLQAFFYQRFGYLYERKRGEFHDGISIGYILPKFVIDREILARVAFACAGAPHTARSTNKDALFEGPVFESVLTASDPERLFFSYRCHQVLQYWRTLARAGDPQLSARTFKHARFGIIYVTNRLEKELPSHPELDEEIRNALIPVVSRWNDFEAYAQDLPKNHNFFRFRTPSHQRRLPIVIEANFGAYYTSRVVLTDLQDFFRIAS